MSSSSTISLFNFNSDSNLLIIGFIYFFISLPTLPLYAFVIYTLHTRDELRSNSSYKLMNIFNICDVLQSFCHIITAFFLIFPELTNRFPIFVRIVGCTANSFWLALFPVMMILSMTRILIAFDFKTIIKWSATLKICLLIGFSYIFIIWSIGCVMQNFEFQPPAWSYDESVPYSTLFARLEMVLCFPTLTLSFISYLIVIIKISKRRRSAQYQQTRHEFAILIQASILTSYMAILILFWHNTDTWFTMTTNSVAIINGAWILFPYLNPILLLITNRSVRLHAARFMKTKLNVSSQLNFGGKPSKIVTEPRKITFTASMIQNN